jgi:hypothetical protein
MRDICDSGCTNAISYDSLGLPGIVFLGIPGMSVFRVLSCPSMIASKGVISSKIKSNAGSVWSSGKFLGYVYLTA